MSFSPAVYKTANETFYSSVRLREGRLLKSVSAPLDGIRKLLLLRKIVIMFNSTRIALNRSCREIVRDLKRQITKTSSVPNSDAISRQQENKFMEEEARRNQWKIINRHNNIRWVFVFNFGIVSV